MKAIGRVAALITIVFAFSACGMFGDDKNENNPNGGGDTGIANVPEPSPRCLDTVQNNYWQPHYNNGFSPYTGYYGNYGQYRGLNGAQTQALNGVGRGYNNGYPHNNGYPQNGYPQNGYPQSNRPWNQPAYYPNMGFCGCDPATQIPVCDNTGGMACVDKRYLQNQRYNVWNYDYQGSRWNQGGYGQIPVNNSCFGGVTKSCRVGTYDCGSGAICMATTNSSAIGVCVAN